MKEQKNIKGTKGSNDTKDSKLQTKSKIKDKDLASETEETIKTISYSPDMKISETNFNFFKSLFAEYCDKETLKVSLETLQDILYANKSINKGSLPTFMAEIKLQLDKLKDPEKYKINEESYFKFIVDIFLKQDQLINENDPEMEKLFESLAGEGNSTIYKNYLINILQCFDLSLDINKFFEPVKDLKELNFHDFCKLFKVRSGFSDADIKSFYSTFFCLADKNPQLEKATATFPIKYIPKNG